MAKNEYVVLEGRKYAGRHKIYKEGEKFKEEELFGNEDNTEMAIKGGGINHDKPRIKVVPKAEKQTQKKDRGRDKDKDK